MCMVNTGFSTYHSSLAEYQRILDELALRGEVKAVVQQLRPAMCDELITQRPHLTVQHK